jgi:hypothetical protein
MGIATIAAAIAIIAGPIAVIIFTLWRATDKIVYGGKALAQANKMEKYSELNTVFVVFAKAVCGQTVLSAIVPPAIARLVASRSTVDVMVVVRQRRFGQPRVTSLNVCQTHC